MARTTTAKKPAWQPQPGRSTTSKSLSWDPIILRGCLEGADKERLDLSTYVMRELRRLQLGRTKISDLSATK